MDPSQIWDLKDSKLISRAGYVLNIPDGWSPQKIGSNVVIEIDKVIGINEETVMVEEQDRQNSDGQQVWTIAKLEIDGHYKFSIGDKFLTSDGSTLSLYTLGIFFNDLNIEN